MNPCPRFYTSSLADFSERAKRVSWLLEAPLQQTQNFLASVYGFADAHEYRACYKSAVSGGKFVAGPFLNVLAEKRRLEFFRTRDVNLLVDRDQVDVRNMLIERTAAFLGREQLNDLGKRYWDIRDIGLMDDPSEHRRKFGRVKRKWEAFDTSDARSRPLALTDYAYLDHSSEDEAVLAFRPTGAAVFEALSEATELADTDYEAFDDRIERMRAAHPNNPWVDAVYICESMRFWWMAGWDGTAPKDAKGGWAAHDANPGHVKYAPSFARSVLPQVRRTISQFESLLEGGHKSAAPHNLVTNTGEDGNDTHYYPAMLYWGGIIALNAGDLKLAKQWLSANRKLVPSDNFGARYYLSVINLATGKGPVANLFPSDNQGTWESLSRFLDYAAHGKFEAAGMAIYRALKHSSHLIQAIDPHFKALSDLRVMTNHDVLAFIQEFFHWTRPFFARQPAIEMAMRAIAGNSEVRSSYVSFHKCNSAAWGSGLMARAEAEKRILDRDTSKDAFKRVVLRVAHEQLSRMGGR